MMRTLFFTTLLSSMLMGCQTSPIQGGQRVLSAAEVQRLFSAHTVESYNLNTGMTSFTYYHPNGRLEQERLWARRTGVWRVREDGTICLTFKNAETKCRHVVERGGKYYKVRTDESGNPERIIRYRYFAAGNALAAR